jgi:hypothetical protein
VTSGRRAASSADALRTASFSGDQVQRVAARVAAHRFVRLVNETVDVLGQPVIAPRHARLVAHPLLHDAPLARRREEEHGDTAGSRPDRGAVHFAAVRLVDERLRIAAELLAPAGDLVRRAPRRAPLAAGGKKPELAIEVLQSFLDRAADRRRHTARMPVEDEDAPERLKPERIGETPQDFTRPELRGEVHDDLARQPHHAAEQPRGRLAAVKRKRRIACVTRR